MKKIKKIILIVIVAFWIEACNKDFETYSLFEVINNSSHVTKLELFGFISQDGHWSNDTTFKLPKGQSVKVDYIYKTGDKNAEDPVIDPFSGADSAYIIFDDTLRIVYKPDDSSPRNILKKNSYTGGKTDRRFFEYHYSITDDDYKNAIKIE